MKPAALTLYYFSGTGNTLKAVGWISNEFQAKSIPTTTTSIDGKGGGIHKEIGREDGLLGLCYPTHGFNLPWVMLKFIFSLPKARKRERFFLLNGRGGTRIYHVFIPGVSGIAQILPMIILLLKGYKLSALLPLDTPTNWIAIHPGMAEWVYNPIIARCERQTRRFARRLLEGKRYFHPYVFIFLPLDLLLLPICLGYSLIGRFFLAKTFYATGSCNKCKICMDTCPLNAIKIMDGRPYWTLSCESCMRCINVCPQKAIQIPHLFATALILLIVALPFKDIIKDQFAIWFPAMPYFIEWFLSLTITSAILLPIFFVAYYVFHILMRYKWLNQLFKYTSLTYYWRRYLAPGVTIKNFKEPRTKQKFLQ